MANIGNWIIKDEKITSQTAYDGTIITESTNTSTKTPHAQLDGTNGTAIFASNVTTYTASGDNTTVKQTIKIDSQAGNVTVAVDGNAQVAQLDAQGLYVRGNGRNPLPSTSPANIRASVAGICNTALQKDVFGTDTFVCGVYGVASNSNSNPAPAYGGYFQNLMAVGLYINTKRINANYNVAQTDVYLSCYNTSAIIIYFPNPQYAGKVFYVKINNAQSVSVDTATLGDGKQILAHDGNTSNSWTWNIRGELIMFVWDGQYWTNNPISK
jgi:hypothetical protein